MSPRTISRKQRTWLAFGIVFGLCLALGAVAGMTRPAVAAPPAGPSPQQAGYAGSESCAACHEGIVEAPAGSRQVPRNGQGQQVERDPPQCGSCVSFCTE